MIAKKVLFEVTCTSEDPQSLARIVGVFAARSLLPRRFVATLTDARMIDLEIELLVNEDEGTSPQHLGRVIERIPSVARMQLMIDGVMAAHTFDVDLCP